MKTVRVIVQSAVIAIAFSLMPTEVNPFFAGSASAQTGRDLGTEGGSRGVRQGPGCIYRGIKNGYKWWYCKNRVGRTYWRKQRVATRSRVRARQGDGCIYRGTRNGYKKYFCSRNGRTYWRNVPVNRVTRRAGGCTRLEMRTTRAHCVTMCRRAGRAACKRYMSYNSRTRICKYVQGRC